MIFVEKASGEWRLCVRLEMVGMRICKNVKTLCS